MAGIAEDVCSVEFFDMIDNTVAVVTLPISGLRLPTPADLSRLECGRSEHKLAAPATWGRAAVQ